MPDASPAGHAHGLKQRVRRRRVFAVGPDRKRKGVPGQYEPAVRQVGHGHTILLVRQVEHAHLFPDGADHPVPLAQGVVPDPEHAVVALVQQLQRRAFRPFQPRMYAGFGQ